MMVDTNDGFGYLLPFFLTIRCLAMTLYGCRL